MIYTLKVVYKFFYVKNLLKCFDAPGGYEKDTEKRQHQRILYRGIQYGSKTHKLYCMTKGLNS